MGRVLHGDPRAALRPGLLGLQGRLGLQAGLLAGLGLAFFSGTAPQEAQATNGLCRGEDQCSFKKPNFMIILDYSASMNEDFAGTGTSRWQTAVNALQNIGQNTFFDENSHFALMRFGHDDNVNQTGTTLPADVSPNPITDGQAIDVEWYDPTNVGTDPWNECNLSDVVTAVQAAGAQASQSG